LVLDGIDVGIADLVTRSFAFLRLSIRPIAVANLEGRLGILISTETNCAYFLMFQFLDVFSDDTPGLADRLCQFRLRGGVPSELLILGLRALWSHSENSIESV
jgi:hypothetical protein